jgi:methyl-accepting chemotaxis protein I, serine sensor receptor
MVTKREGPDILPPPMYLIEMRLVLSPAVEGSLPPEKATSEFQRLRQEYEARVSHWRAHPSFGLERHLLGRQHEQAQA